MIFFFLIFEKVPIESLSKKRILKFSQEQSFSENKESLNKELKSTLSQVESLMMLDISNFKSFLQKKAQEQNTSTPTIETNSNTKNKIIEKVQTKSGKSVPKKSSSHVIQQSPSNGKY